MKASNPAVATAKFAEAERMIITGYEGMKARWEAIPVQGKKRLPEALERLVSLYVELGKPEETAKWRRELDSRPAEERNRGTLMNANLPAFDAKSDN
jgi:lipopolysaccharide biosynthesis regulator YciM